MTQPNILNTGAMLLNDTTTNDDCQEDSLPLTAKVWRNRRWKLNLLASIHAEIATDINKSREANAIFKRNEDKYIEFEACDLNALDMSQAVNHEPLTPYKRSHKAQA